MAIQVQQNRSPGYYQALSSLISAKAQRDVASITGHYQLMGQAVTTLGNTIGQGLNNYYSYQLEREKMSMLKQNHELEYRQKSLSLQRDQQEAFRKAKVDNERQAMRSSLTKLTTIVNSPTSVDLAALRRNYAEYTGKFSVLEPENQEIATGVLNDIALKKDAITELSLLDLSTAVSNPGDANHIAALLSVSQQPGKYSTGSTLEADTALSVLTGKVPFNSAKVATWRDSLSPAAYTTYSAIANDPDRHLEAAITVAINKERARALRDDPKGSTLKAFNDEILRLKQVDFVSGTGNKNLEAFLRTRPGADLPGGNITRSEAAKSGAHAVVSHAILTDITDSMAGQKYVAFGRNITNISDAAEALKNPELKTKDPELYEKSLKKMYSNFGATLGKDVAIQGGVMLGGLIGSGVLVKGGTAGFKQLIGRGAKTLTVDGKTYAFNAAAASRNVSSNVATSFRNLTRKSQRDFLRALKPVDGKPNTFKIDPEVFKSLSVKNRQGVAGVGTALSAEFKIESIVALSDEAGLLKTALGVAGKTLGRTSPASISAIAGTIFGYDSSFYRPMVEHYNSLSDMDKLIAIDSVARSQLGGTWFGARDMDSLSKYLKDGIIDLENNPYEAVGVFEKTGTFIRNTAATLTDVLRPTSAEVAPGTISEARELASLINGTTPDAFGNDSNAIATRFTRKATGLHHLLTANASGRERDFNAVANPYKFFSRGMIPALDKLRDNGVQIDLDGNIQTVSGPMPWYMVILRDRIPGATSQARRDVLESLVPAAPPFAGGAPVTAPTAIPFKKVE